MNLTKPKENGMPGEAHTNGQSAARRRAQVVDRAREGLAALNAELENLEADDDDAGDGATHIHVHTGAPAAATADAATADAARLTAVETNLATVAKTLETQGALLAQIAEKLGKTGGTTNDGDPDPDPEDGDALPEEITAARAKTGDSSALATSFQAVISDAEVLAPGYRLPAFDGKAKRKATIDSMCQLRRGVLQHVSATMDGAVMLAALQGGSVTLDPAKATCVEVASLFRSAAATKKLLNNGKATNDASRVPPAASLPGARKGPPSMAELQKQNDEFWKKQH